MKFAPDSVWGIQNTPIVRVGNLEGKEERRNTLSKEVGVGHGAGDMDERLVGENRLRSPGVETVETIGPVYSTLSFIIDKQINCLQETYEDSVGKTPLSAAEFLQQKVVEHQKVLVCTIVNMINFIVLAQSRLSPEVSHAT